ncbi:MAG: HEAT repeat domain-containing protein [Planctomycetota bacterium]
MPRICVVAFTLSLLATTLLAQESRAKSYRPWLDRVLLGEAPLIVRGRLSMSSRLPNGERVDRITVIETLKGERRATRLLLAGTKNLGVRPKLSKLFFLRPSPKGRIDRLVDFVDLPEFGGSSRLVFVRGLLAAIQEPLELRRLQSVKSLILKNIKSASPWVRRVVVRELDALVFARASLFDGGDLLPLQKLRVRDLPAIEQGMHRQSLTKIESTNAVGWTQDRLTFPSPQAKAAFLRDFASFQRGGGEKQRKDFLNRVAKRFGRRAAPLFHRSLSDDSLALRRHAVFLLGDLESSFAAIDLESIALQGSDLGVRKEALTALAKIASPRSLTFAESLVSHPDLGPDALRLVASIGGKDAVAFLRSYRSELTKKPDLNPKDLKSLDYLLSADFRDELLRARAARLKLYAP